MQINDLNTFSENSYDVLNDLLLESQSELDECFSLLKKNEEELETLNEQIRQLELKTDRDISIFSPRNNSDSCYELLQHSLELQEKLKSDNDFLTAKYQKYVKRNNELKSLLKSKENGKENGKEITIEHMFEHNSSLFSTSNLTVLDIQEKERQRIARDLHDTALQSLIHLIHKFELCSKYIDVDPVQAQLEIATCTKCLKDLIEESRSSIFNLRPMSFDDFGFLEVMRRLKTNLEERSDILVDFQIDDPCCEEPLILITIYRIIQEACNNAIKHSQGSKLFVKTERNDSFYHCKIEDNGIGFQVNEVSKKKNHFGMAMLSEQVSLLSGTYHIQSELGKGTVVEIDIPVSIMKGVINE